MDSDVAPERGPSLFITLESLYMEIMTGKKDDVCAESISPYCCYLDLLRYRSVGEWRIVEEILSPTKQKERGRRGSLHDGRAGGHARSTRASDPGAVSTSCTTIFPPCKDYVHRTQG